MIFLLGIGWAELFPPSTLRRFPSGRQVSARHQSITGVVLYGSQLGILAVAPRTPKETPVRTTSTVPRSSAIFAVGLGFKGWSLGREEQDRG